MAHGSPEGSGDRSADPNNRDKRTTVAAETDLAATEANQVYSDKAILALDELNAAPDFKYASSTLAGSAMQPAGADRTMKRTTPQSAFWTGR
jgi:hypothetical protein